MAAFVLWFATTGFSQKSLDSNPVYQGLLPKTLRYPKKANWRSLYGRIFTKFEVDKKGQIKNIEIVYPTISKDFEQKSGFETAIRKALNDLPLLGLGYQGQYLLPISFVYTNYGKTPMISFPTNGLPEFIDVNGLTPLREIEVKGYSSTIYEYSILPEIAPPSKQIID